FRSQQGHRFPPFTNLLFCRTESEADARRVRACWPVSSRLSHTRLILAGHARHPSVRARGNNTMKLLVTAVIGGVVGVCIGYAIYAFSRGTAGYSFVYWLTSGRPRDAVLWAVIGAGVAAGLSFLRRS